MSTPCSTLRLEILAEVEKLADSIGLNGEDVAYTCETAGYFWKIHVLAKWEKFTADVATAADDDQDVVARVVSVCRVFRRRSNQPLFTGTDRVADMSRAKGMHATFKDDVHRARRMSRV